jgi:Ca2+-binding EF-hand superfamily protein
MGHLLSRVSEKELNSRSMELCTGLFQQIDIDHHQDIDISEAREWWKNNYSVINSRALFEAVDQDHDGIITLNEWVQFWTMVKNRGHTDEEIQEELENISEKMSWIDFDGMPKLRPKIKD